MKIFANYNNSNNYKCCKQQSFSANINDDSIGAIARTLVKNVTDKNEIRELKDYFVKELKSSEFIKTVVGIKAPNGKEPNISVYGFSQDPTWLAFEATEGENRIVRELETNRLSSNDIKNKSLEIMQTICGELGEPNVPHWIDLG